MVSRKALGKGLGALIPDQGRVKLVVTELPVGEIVKNRYQPRLRFNDASIKELAESIKEKGVIQPVLVQKVAKGYELIAGERRLRAVKSLGKKTIPAIIKSVHHSEALELAILENIQREDLSPIEEAKGYKLLMDEFKLTQEAIGKKVGRERSTVANTLRLLKLPKIIQKDMEEGKLTMGHARALLACKSEAEMMQVRKQILQQGLNVREVEQKTKKKKPKSQKISDPNIRDLEGSLRKILSTKVMLKQNAKGGGTLVIEFYNNEDLDRITEAIKKGNR